METHPPNMLTPPQPKKPRPSVPNGENNEFSAMTSMSGTHTTHFLSSQMVHTHTMYQDQGASNSSEVSSSLANNVPPSSVAAEGMMMNETVLTSSVPSTAPPPGSVPQRTPQQVAPQGASPLPVNQVKSAANITGQPMQPMGGALQQPSPPPPAAASGTGEEFPPRGTQQQSQSFAQLLSMTRNDGEMGVLQGNGGIPPRTGIDGRLPPSSSSNPPPPGDGGGGGGSSCVSPDQEKTKLIQQQLVLLLHAHKCLQRERESESYRCSLPHCQVMKEVFRHIMQCTKTRDCSYPHCASSRQIIQHWKSCGQQDCSICMPVKGVIKPPGTIAQAGGGATAGGAGGQVDGNFAGPVSSAPAMQALAGQPPPPGEHWQSSVRQDVRDYLIKKILNGIYPVHDYNSAMTNPQYLKLVQFIQRVEDNFFRTCTSKDEYFAKLADKYQHLMKELHRTYPGPGEVKPMVPPTPTPVSQPMYQQRPAVPMPTSSNPGSVPPTRSVDSGLSQLYKEVDETLHTQGEEWFLYTCNMCQQPVETCYHCSECEDFDLCVCCYEKNGHAHSMTRLGMDLGIHDEGAGPKDPKEALNQAIQRFIQVLMHAAQCRDRTCKSPSCAKMKRIMHHVGRCKQCVVCKQFLNLCLQHAKTCKSSNCPVPLCANIKKHLQEKQRQASFQESRFAARRMLAMRSAMPSSSSSASNSNASSNAAAATAVQSPAPSTPARQQPGTPQQPPQVTNSPAPSPAVGRNPPSIPPPSVSHQSPGGKALGALQQSQDAQQTHGPPSIPSKPMNAAAPSPHSAATVSYQSPGGPPSVGKPPGREQIMNIRKNPQQAMDAIAQLAPQPTAYSGQPQVPGVRPVTNPTNRYATHMTPSAQPYPAHHHQGYMDGSTGANMVSSYTTARYPQHPQQRMVSTHPSYVHQQPVGHMYPQGGQTAYGQPTMGSQAMYNQRVMMAQSARPMYSGVSGVMQQSPYSSIGQQQQPTMLQRAQPMGVPPTNMPPMVGGVGMSVHHPHQHQQRYQGAPGGPPMGATYQQQQQQMYPTNAMPPQPGQAQHHHGDPTLNTGYHQGPFQPGYSNVERLDQVANQL